MTTPDFIVRQNDGTVRVTNQQQTFENSNGVNGAASKALFKGEGQEIGDNFKGTDDGTLYVVKSGDTLYKIAKKLGITLEMLLQLNPEITNPNMISIGQKIKTPSSVSNVAEQARIKLLQYQKTLKTSSDFTRNSDVRTAFKNQDTLFSAFMKIHNPSDISSAAELSDEEFSQAVKILSKPYGVHAGMTREDAEEIGGKVLEDFNRICTNGSIVTNDDIIKAKQQDLAEAGISSASIFKSINESSGMERIKKYKELLSIISNESLVPDKFKDVKSKEDLFKVLGITSEELESTGNDPEKIGELIGKKIREELKKAMDPSDENSILSQELRRLEKGDFNEVELAQGYVKGQGIKDPKKLTQMAYQSVVKSYLSSVSGVSLNVFEGTDDQTKLAAIHGLFKALEDSSQIKNLLSAIGIESITDQDTRKLAAKTVYENTKDDLDLNNITDFALANTVITNGDEETVQNLIQDNADQLDMIKVIADGVIKSMPDGEAKESLRKVLETTISNVESGTASSKINLNGKPDEGKTAKAAPPYQTNPMSPDAYKVAETREASMQYQIQQSQFQQMSPEQFAKQELTEFMEEMSQRGAIMHAKLENMPFAEALSLVCDNLNRVPEEYRGKVKTKFTNMVIRKASAYPDMMCEAYLQGSDNLRTFLKKEHIITENKVYSYFDKKPAALNLAPDKIRISYYKYKSEEERKLI